MDPLAVLLTMLALALTLWVISGPLRGGAEREEVELAARIADLKAAKEARYLSLIHI